MKTIYSALIILPLLCSTLTGCGKPAQPASSTRPQAAAEQASHVVITPEFAKALTIEELQPQNVVDLVRVSAKVHFDDRQVARSGASVTGRVTDLRGDTGMQVRAGDTLATINSTELGSAQLVYLKASAQADLQARTVERARQLHSADVIGHAELQKRESELAIAQAEQRAAADQLRVLGMSPQEIQRLGKHGHINSIASVASTLNGEIVERHVALGQVVQPSDALFVVADLSRVWVVAEVPEQQAADVRTGQAVDIEVPSLHQRLSGKLVYGGNTVNPETRTFTVRCEVQNPKDHGAFQLKPAMLATMRIQSHSAQRLVVPAKAVVRDNDQEFVVLRGDKLQFERIPVKLGEESQGLRPVLDGIKAGQAVVVDGAFHLHNEFKRQALEAREAAQTDAAAHMAR